MTLTCLLAVQQREQDALPQKHAGGGVADRDADAHRAAPGFAGDGHEAAHALHDLVDPGSRGIGAVLPEAGNARQDDARVDGFQLLVGDAQALLYRSAKVLDDHVGLRDQFLQYLRSGGGLEIDAQAALVAMQVLLVGAAPLPGYAADFLVGRRIDADDISPPVRQQAHRGGPRARNREIEDRVARKGAGVGRLAWHGGFA